MSSWITLPEQWKRDIGVSVVAALITAVAMTFTGLLDYDVQSTEDEFTRMERLLNNAEQRQEHFANRAEMLYHERADLRIAIDSLSNEIAELQWENRQLRRDLQDMRDRMQKMENGPAEPSAMPMPTDPPRIWPFPYEWTFIPTT